MFIGHFAVGFAAKKAAPRASLGTLVAAAVFLDAVWPVLVLCGVESFRIVPGITAFSPFEFVSYPWSHSLLMAAFWSAVFAAVHFSIRKDAFTAKVLAAVVFSHWILDWVSHRPDLQLAPGIAVRTGLGLWRSVPAIVVVEGSMFAGAVAIYTRCTTATDRVGRWAWVSFVGVLALLYASSLGPPPPAGRESMVAWVDIVAMLFVPWAAWIDRHRAFGA